jgi:hypothetical protein
VLISIARLFSDVSHRHLTIIKGNHSLSDILCRSLPKGCRLFGSVQDTGEFSAGGEDVFDGVHRGVACGYGGEAARR